jgi:hypothetical protein
MGVKVNGMTIFQGSQVLYDLSSTKKGPKNGQKLVQNRQENDVQKSSKVGTKSIKIWSL